MATLTVGTGNGFEFSTLASAIAASQDGDVIQVQAGTYTNDFAAITTSITIEGVGGLVNLVATVPPLDQKGILIIGQDGTPGPNVTIDNVSFSGAAISDDLGGNGAGIRYQSGNLTLNNTYFFDNQEGLLADADPNGTITINNSEFNNNGNANPPSSGVEHNLYVGAIQQLTIDNSYFINPIVGHDIKSRAANTTIENSRIVDPNGTGSYEIDLPNGGNAVITNNVIEKAAGSQDNPYFIAYGEEGNLYPSSSLSVTGNTLINDFGSGANLLLNDAGLTPTVTGNTAYNFTASQLPTPQDNTLSNSAEPALNTSPPYLPVIPFTFACFAAGTRLLTSDGEVPVETLRAGQQVMVLRPGGQHAVRPVRWIGHRYIDFARHADPRQAHPIRIRAEAFADGVPRRDVLMSPDHAIFAAGMLIPARLLQNGATILRDDRLQGVQYFHVELDRHDILFAEGLPAESYLDTGNRGVFENAQGPLLLHPDLAASNPQIQRELSSCAPFAADAERVEPIWRSIAVRASQLGFQLAEPAVTTDPALHLLVDGRPCWPVAATNGRYIFVLPRSAASVRLVSRATAPCDAAPWIEDRRSLGVAIGRIILTGPTGPVELPPDHPSLIDGWWAHEHDDANVWRWTNGSAALPLPARTSTLEIHLAGQNTYLLAPRATVPRWLSEAA